MYRAKLGGRNGYRFFGGDTQDERADWDEMERDLHNALPRNQLVLHYQPQVNVQTGDVVGAEALLRWTRPGWGVLGPAAFLPVAEATGLIISITEWVLQQACQQAATWQREWGRPIDVSVNVSARALNDSGFHDMLRAVLDAAGLDPARLTLEVTQDVAFATDRETGEALASLLRLGVRVCVDNYGIDEPRAGGEASSGCFDCIKIDMSLVQALSEREGAIDRIRTILRTARARRLRLIAIGVETERHFSLLREEDVLIMQGFHLGRPCPAAKFDELLSGGGLLHGARSPVGA
jgi:EAL domain-containing protein (putative c-di-GMP-specific phosphodiesterase class I)